MAQNQHRALEQALKQILLELSHGLPAQWGALEPKLVAYLRQLETEPEQAALVEARLHRLLNPYPALHQRLLELLEADQSQPELTMRGVEIGGDTHVTRYSDILAPSHVPVQQRFPLIIGLTCQPNPDSRDTQPLQVKPGQTVQVMLTPSEQLTVLGPRLKPVFVLADADSEPAVFYLLAQQPGDHQVQIDFWCDGQVAATSVQTICAVAETAIITRSQATTQLLQMEETRVAHPDLIMRISTLDNRLRFDLHYAEIDFKHFAGERLRSDPEQYRYNLIKEIEALTRESSEDADFVVRELGKIGQRLYRDLWPAELRREYRRLRKMVHTFQIISDEPWIPWELLKPYNSEDPQDRVDDDFLCLQFDFARWFTPARPPAQHFPIRSLAAIRPNEGNLAAGPDEERLLRAWADKQGWQDHTPATPNKRQVEQLLGGARPIDLWHFICHGNFNAKQPGRAPLYLQDGTELTPDDLVGAVEDRLRTDRPLVFLNACRVGASGLSLTGLGGWAKVMIQNCGVGAFLAPAWTVGDQHAYRFAETFYQSWQTPQTTLAQAVRQARQQLRELAPNDPIWLAYSLYGHPNAALMMANNTGRAGGREH